MTGKKTGKTEHREPRVIGVPKKPRKQRHVPQRTCVGCRQVLPKRSLIRIVRTPAGVEIDPTGKLAGRGAYLHDRRSCWERALKGALANALRIDLTAEDQGRLSAFMASLAEDDALSSNAVQSTVMQNNEAQERRDDEHV
jgi:predicted RNA-binding protein YlxR (DUF448 family)